MAGHGRCVGVLAAVALLTGCGSRSGVLVPESSGGDNGQATTRARQVLARYEKVYPGSARGAVGVTSELVSQLGEWEPTNGANDKIAVLSGHVALRAAASGPAGRSVVRWADGKVMPVRTVSARAAVETLKNTSGQQDCYGCTAVVLGHPQLTRRTVETTTGRASVPAWSFSVRGSRVRVTVVAVDAAFVVPTLPEVGAPPGPYVGVDSAEPLGPRSLVLHFTGAHGTARQSCGADYTTTAIESAHAVAVLVRALPHDGAEACPAVGYFRTATVQLTAPLAGRAVLDAVHGQAVRLGPARG